MGITHEDVRDITLHWLKQTNLKPTCPVCKSETWKIGIVSELPDGLVAGGIFRVIPLVCANCAYTMLFSADPITLPLPKGQ